MGKSLLRWYLIVTFNKQRPFLSPKTTDKNKNKNIYELDKSFESLQLKIHKRLAYFLEILTFKKTFLCKLILDISILFKENIKWNVKSFLPKLQTAA